MTIRNLFQAFTNDTCGRVEIYDEQYRNASFGTLVLNFSGDTLYPGDMKIFDTYADFTIKEWYVTCDGIIRIMIEGGDLT